MSSPVAQAAAAGLPRRRGQHPAGADPISGSRANATDVPRRPAATAPVATGSSAYDAASSTRAVHGGDQPAGGQVGGQAGQRHAAE